MASNLYDQLFGNPNFNSQNLFQPGDTNNNGYNPYSQLAISQNSPLSPYNQDHQNTVNGLQTLNNPSLTPSPDTTFNQGTIPSNPFPNAPRGTGTFDNYSNDWNGRQYNENGEETGESKMMNSKGMKIAQGIRNAIMPNGINIGNSVSAIRGLIESSGYPTNQSAERNNLRKRNQMRYQATQPYTPWGMSSSFIAQNGVTIGKLNNLPPLNQPLNLSPEQQQAIIQGQIAQQQAVSQDKGIPYNPLPVATKQEKKNLEEASLKANARLKKLSKSFPSSEELKEYDRVAQIIGINPITDPNNPINLWYNNLTPEDIQSLNWSNTNPGGIKDKVATWEQLSQPHTASALEIGQRTGDYTHLLTEPIRAIGNMFSKSVNKGEDTYNRGTYQYDPSSGYSIENTPIRYNDPNAYSYAQEDILGAIPLMGTNNPAGTLIAKGTPRPTVLAAQALQAAKEAEQLVQKTLGTIPEKQKILKDAIDAANIEKKSLKAGLASAKKNFSDLEKSHIDLIAAKKADAAKRKKPYLADQEVRNSADRLSAAKADLEHNKLLLQDNKNLRKVDLAKQEKDLASETESLKAELAEKTKNITAADKALFEAQKDRVGNNWLSKKYSGFMRRFPKEGEITATQQTKASEAVTNNLRAKISNAKEINEALQKGEVPPDPVYTPKTFGYYFANGKLRSAAKTRAAVAEGKRSAVNRMTLGGANWNFGSYANLGLGLGLTGLTGNYFISNMKLNNAQVLPNTDGTGVNNTDNVSDSTKPRILNTYENNGTSFDTMQTLYNRYNQDTGITPVTGYLQPPPQYYLPQNTEEADDDYEDDYLYGGNIMHQYNPNSYNPYNPYNNFEYGGNVSNNKSVQYLTQDQIDALIAQGYKIDYL